MTKAEMARYLSDLGTQFHELMLLLDANSESLSLISERYSDIKERVSNYLAELEKKDKKGVLNADESAMLLPAIREVSLHCTARKGSKNIQELTSSIYDGQSYCSYWVSQLTV